MPRKTAKTIRLEPEGAQALKRAQADGPKGQRRPPKVTLFVSTDPHLGEESQFYKDFRD